MTANPTPQPPSMIAYIVVGGQVFLAVIVTVSLCFTLFYKNWSDPTVLVALIGLDSVLIGNLGSILGGPMRQMMLPTVQKAEIVNPPSDPVPVTQGATL